VPDLPGTRLARLYARLGARQGKKLYGLVSDPSARKHLDKKVVAAIPERERERLRRAEELEESSLSSTHPPTAYRLGALRAVRSAPVGAATGVLELSVADEEAIVREVARLYPSLTAGAVERYKRRLYH